MTTLLPEYRIILPEAPSFHPATLFINPIRAVWLELGFGYGDHLAAMALAHSDIGMIGCDPFINGIAHLLSLIEHHHLTNIRIFPNDARLLLDRMAGGSIERCFLLFADPWPKKRHHKRRFITTQSLNCLAHILADKAELLLASDHPSLVHWMFDHTWHHPDFVWLARCAADWKNHPIDCPFTRYEKKALSAGRKVTFLRFQRRIRPSV